VEAGAYVQKAACAAVDFGEAGGGLQMRESILSVVLAGPIRPRTSPSRTSSETKSEFLG
jgi:hypothetical protein